MRVLDLLTHVAKLVITAKGKECRDCRSDCTAPADGFGNDGLEALAAFEQEQTADDHNGKAKQLCHGETTGDARAGFDAEDVEESRTHDDHRTDDLAGDR